MKDKRVVIIDDMDSMRDIIALMLKKTNFSFIDNYHDPLRALKKIQSNDYSCDLVICDWFMPTMSGADFLKKIRMTPHLKKVKFLMLIDESEQDDILDAVKNGADNFLVKPFTQKQLEEKIHFLFSID